MPLEEFFKVLIYGYEVELRNRFLKIGQEYGTPTGEAVKGLHRHNVGIRHGNDGINYGINFSGAEEKAIKIEASCMSVGRLMP